MASRSTYLAVVIVLVSLPLIAQPARTFVSAAGNDVNVCSLTMPCRSLQRGVDAVAANGEVVPLDSAGYGVVNITKSVTIAVPAGVYGGVSALMGQTGIFVNTAGIDVKLRGLSVNSLGGDNGVFVFASNVTMSIERSSVSGFPNAGVWFNSIGGRLVVFDSLVRDSGVGIGVTSGDAANPAVAVIDHSQFSGNGGGSSGAVSAEARSKVSVHDSVAHANFRGFQVVAEDPDPSTMKVESSSATGNAVGVFATSSSMSPIATMYVSNCLIAHNSLFAIEAQGASLIHSRGNNTVVDNAGGETFSDTYAAK